MNIRTACSPSGARRILVAASLVFAWFILIPLLGFLFDVGLYLATAKRDEVVYLTNSQEIMPEDNVHSVQGCYELPCTDENSFYFRIRATLFNEVWSVVHGRGLFFPDYVAASVPLSISQCTITSYGVRLKLIMRGADIYPDLLKTECTPMTGEALRHGALDEPIARPPIRASTEGRSTDGASGAAFPRLPP